MNSLLQETMSNMTETELAGGEPEDPNFDEELPKIPGVDYGKMKLHVEDAKTRKSKFSANQI